MLNQDQDWSFLKKVKFFSSFPDDILKKIYKLGDIRTYNRGSNIIIEGEQSSGLYCVLEGSVNVYKNAIENVQTGFRLASLSVGNVFGELSLIDEQPRSATVTAAEPVMMFFLDGDQWRAFLRDHADIEMSFLRSLALILSSRIRVLDRELSFSHKLLWKMRFASEENQKMKHSG